MAKWDSRTPYLPVDRREDGAIVPIVVGQVKYLTSRIVAAGHLPGVLRFVGGQDEGALEGINRSHHVAFGSGRTLSHVSPT